MKKLIILIAILFSTPLILQAAIPMAQSVTVEPAKEQLVINPAKESKLKKLAKTIKQKLALRRRSNNDTGIFNTLSLACGVAGIALSIFTGLGGIPFFIAAIVLGIIGLTRREKYQGFGIAGIIIGGLAALLFLLAIGIIIALFGGL